MSRVTRNRSVLRLENGRARPVPDTVVVEEPLEIRVGGDSLAVTMRTPGDDFDLIIGFLLTEGVIAKHSDVSALRYCAGADDEGANTYNVIDVSLTSGVAAPSPDVARNFFTTSSCGVCGKASIDAVRTTTSYPLGADQLFVRPETLAETPESLRDAQRVFSRTGGLHAAGLFGADGTLLALREDVGRHNAVDKLIGHGVRSEWLPISDAVLLVSGRASFELTQKALMAGIPMLAAVSAPSSLAIELADEAGMTLVGFLRGATMNVYSGAHRIALY